MSSMSGGLSLLDDLREDFVVICSELLGLLEALNLSLLNELLSSKSLLGNESLDLGALVEGFVTLLDLAADNVLSHVVLLAKSEDLADVAGSLGSESARLVVGGNTLDFSITLLDNLESDHSKIGTADASTD